LLWLEVISRFGVNVCGGPNFAYDLCVNQISGQQTQALDLSTWRVAFVGSEPVSQNVIGAFADSFAQCGFDVNAIHPCYGLAEACLFVAGCVAAEPPVVMTFDRPQLQRQTASLKPLDIMALDTDMTKTIQLVAAGQLTETSDIRVVDYETKTMCSDGVMGEIWVANQGVQNSYWGDIKQSTQTFNAFNSLGEGPFLRTGDLGFIYQSQLFITARLKDLVIIRGKNHAPQDIEQSVQQCDAALQRDAGVAFSHHDDNECLIIVQEVKRTYMRSADLGDIIRNIRRAVLENHEIDPAVVVLIRPASLPKTTSGKVQRNATKSRYINDELLVIKRQVMQYITPEHNGRPDEHLRCNSQWENTLLDLWADVLNKPMEQIGVFDNFFDLGGDSLMAQQIIGYLLSHHHIEIEGSEMYHAPTISALANVIEQQLGQSIDENEEQISGEI
jgi:acyl-CoA synthetase (AMP-forming)/AMP-acid ligase II/acyl carrier protein